MFLDQLKPLLKESFCIFLTLINYKFITLSINEEILIQYNQSYKLSISQNGDQFMGVAVSDWVGPDWANLIPVYIQIELSSLRFFLLWKRIYILGFNFTMERKLGRRNFLILSPINSIPCPDWVIIQPQGEKCLSMNIIRKNVFKKRQVSMLYFPRCCMLYWEVLVYY